MLKAIDGEKKSKQMKRHMRRNTLDVSWRRFFDVLSYKAEWAGKTMVKVSLHITHHKSTNTGRTLTNIIMPL